ncbi:hypothetical protein [Paenisporosarcina sp. TG20]|uniref:hypothetical protein n=1 Tax=Paenisporosarcina sp. TG20 TaxID=1211706 RepID=UPI0002EFA2BF|nr:hypothetical protein [Paenisporosarcina sp. TG20]
MNGLMKSCKQILSSDIKIVSQYIGIIDNPTRRFVFGALLASFAAILQSAGILGGFGFFVSALSTLPILIATIISKQLGILTYIVEFAMISMIQPSELFAFPFTTGLLGLCMGFAFGIFKKGFFVTVFSGVSLTLGILFILYIIQFPLLGPSVTSSVDMNIIMVIALFSILYSWIWMKVLILLVKKINRMIGKGPFHF